MNSSKFHFGFLIWLGAITNCIAGEVLHREDVSDFISQGMLNQPRLTQAQKNENGRQIRELKSMVDNEITRLEEGKQKFIKIQEDPKHKNDEEFKGLYITPYDNSINELQKFSLKITPETTKEMVETKICNTQEEFFPPDNDE